LKLLIEMPHPASRQKDDLGLQKLGEKAKASAPDEIRRLLIECESDF
jgi:hypothetical protein